MNRLFPLPFIVLAALALAFAACSSSDDKSSEAPDSQPTATAVTSDGADSADGQDDSGGGAADSRGSGTAVIADETFEFPVDTCIIESLEQGGSVLIGGPSMTAGGEAAYVWLEYHNRDRADAMPGVTVGVGSTSSFDVEQGTPVYVGSAEGDFTAEVNGGAHIAFTGSNFGARGGDSIEPLEGSVDVTCQ